MVMGSRCMLARAVKPGILLCLLCNKSSYVRTMGLYTLDIVSVMRSVSRGQ